MIKVTISPIKKTSFACLFSKLYMQGGLYIIWHRGLIFYETSPIANNNTNATGEGWNQTSGVWKYIKN